MKQLIAISVVLFAVNCFAQVETPTITIDDQSRDEFRVSCIAVGVDAVKFRTVAELAYRKAVYTAIDGLPSSLSYPAWNRTVIGGRLPIAEVTIDLETLAADWDHLLIADAQAQSAYESAHRFVLNGHRLDMFYQKLDSGFVTSELDWTPGTGTALRGVTTYGGDNSFTTEGGIADTLHFAGINYLDGFTADVIGYGGEIHRRGIEEVHTATGIINGVESQSTVEVYGRQLPKRLKHSFGIISNNGTPTNAINSSPKAADTWPKTGYPDGFRVNSDMDIGSRWYEYKSARMTHYTIDGKPIDAKRFGQFGDTLITQVQDGYYLAESHVERANGMTASIQMWQRVSHPEQPDEIQPRFMNARFHPKNGIVFASQEESPANQDFVKRWVYVYDGAKPVMISKENKDRIKSYTVGPMSQHDIPNVLLLKESAIFKDNQTGVELPKLGLECFMSIEEWN